MFSILCSILCFHLDSVVFWTTLHFMFPSDSVISGYVSCDFLDIYFMFSFHYSLCFSHMHYVTFLDSAVPLNPILLSLLNLLRSCTCILLQCIHLLVYISCVLVATNLRTNITCSRLYLSEVFWNTQTLWLSSSCLTLLCSCFHSLLVHILVRTVNSCPPDSTFHPLLGTSGSKHNTHTKSPMNTANLSSQSLVSLPALGSRSPPQLFQQSLALLLPQTYTTATNAGMQLAIGGLLLSITIEASFVPTQISSVILPSHSFQRLKSISLELGSHYPG